MAEFLWFRDEAVMLHQTEGSTSDAGLLT